MLRKFVTKFVAYFQRILRIPETKFVGFSKFVGFLATNEFVTFYTTDPCVMDPTSLQAQNSPYLTPKCRSLHITYCEVTAQYLAIALASRDQPVLILVQHYVFCRIEQTYSNHTLPIQDFFIQHKFA